MRGNEIKEIKSKETLFSHKYFKDQISFYLKVDELKLASQEAKINFLPGFLNGKVTKLANGLFNFMNNVGGKRAILELPPFAGKTLVSFALAYFRTHDGGKNSLIVYPNKLQKDISVKFLKRYLEKITFDQFPNFINVDSYENFHKDNIYCPQIYIMDVFTLHKFFINRITPKFFWEQMQTIIIEDVGNYTGNIASEAAYLIRRLLAKVESYNPKFDILVSTRPVNRSVNHISALTGIKKEIFKVFNIDNSYIPESEILNWYPHIKDLEYKNNQIAIIKNGYFDELRGLIRSLLDKRSNNVALLLQKGFLSINEKNAFTQGSEANGTLFVGNNLDEIRNELLDYDTEMDINDIDTIIIAGISKPIKVYLSELMHVGNLKRRIIFFDNITPSTQYQFVELLKSEKSELYGTVSSQEMPIINLSNNNIILKNRKYLKEEIPTLNDTIIKTYFPEVFWKNYNSTSLQESDLLILDKDLKFWPSPSRTQEEFQIEENSKKFKITLSDQEIGTIDQNVVRIGCYPGARWIFESTQYLIQSVDYENKNIKVETIVENNKRAFTFKVAEYQFKKEDVEVLETTLELNGRISIASGSVCTTEVFLGVKITSDFQNFIFNPSVKNDSFPESKLQVIQFTFRDELFAEFNEDVEIFAILHTFGHLLLEVCMIDNVIDISQIKLQISRQTPSNEAVNNNQGNIPYSIYLVNLSEDDNSIFNYLLGTETISLLKKMENILLQCPCQDGSKTCIEIDYCNILNCGITNMKKELDKLNTLKFISCLLDRPSDEIEKTIRWKTFSEEITMNSGVAQDDYSKLESMAEFARDIILSKGLLKMGKFSPVRFFTKEEAVQYSNELGFSNDKEIVIRPGYSELELLQTIFYEYFHNYQNLSNHLCKIHHDLRFFDWENIDNPKNIPYAGMLIVEGSAVWFSFRMFEFFLNVQYIGGVENLGIFKYFSGLQVMLEIENKFGYLGTIERIDSGKDINIQDYYISFNSTFNRERDTYQKENELEKMLCLKQNEKLSDLNRVSFLLTAHNDSTIISKGLKDIKDGKYDKLKHVKFSNIEFLANQTIDDYNSDNKIKKILSENGLQNKEEESTNLICYKCDSDCNLFTACMINKGRELFSDIVLKKYPATSAQKRR